MNEDAPFFEFSPSDTNPEIKKMDTILFWYTNIITFKYTANNKYQLDIENEIID